MRIITGSIVGAAVAFDPLSYGDESLSEPTVMAQVGRNGTGRHSYPAT